MSKTLNNKVIVITRPIERSKFTFDIVKEFGGVPLVVPTLELKFTDTPNLRRLLKKLKELDWLIFTSPASLESIFNFCPDLKEHLNPQCKIAVIGPKTKRIVESKGLTTEIMPSEYTAEGLLDSFLEYDLEGKIIGIPSTLAARDVLLKELTKMGAHVFVAEAYKSIVPEETDLIEDLIKKILDKEISAITFTSPLTVKNLFNLVEKEHKPDFIKILSKKEVLVAAIGPITGKTLQEYGINALIPEKYTVKDMMLKLFDNL
ncbi:MAG: uroporphyrinogen-III synthase [Methanobacteriaceae archaeon]|nr:uroporphyrinogen-III synthase [Methanobacteriaceae archaeon]MDP2837452.1 uroporphyrinogen-III synthase [Methanobacteriaceae archaeon]MDP3035621.1 uroporphyrinogen-III synthase [Methanobacteriaceae archaeon]MDP3486099.1 uroporphyrinogen-III synthase [Methanobacteriaceae archaeon]MDP3623629.1 uroporphyrinogen-III synthase [Methanobacteriaceae archaeon]